MQSSAATLHCNVTDGTKYEVGGDRTRINLDLAAGTKYCIKVGTKIAQGVVGADGDVVNKTIKNSAGKLMGISYYVVYGTPPGGGSGSS